MVEEEDPKEEGEVASPPTHDQQDLPQTYIVKGKRTKRQRPQSPIPFTITAHTQHSSSGDADFTSNNDHLINNINTDTTNLVNHNSSSSSAEQGGDHPYPSNTTTEDEYTARCLILLAQGSQNVESRKHDQDYGVPEKFNSKRYIEAPISGNGKAGMYVYECKTCGRTFPSFQALGGHRASHKKPKNIAADQKKMFINDYISDDDEYEMTLFKKHKTSNNNNYSSLSLEFNMGNRGIQTNIHKSASFPRIHECSHCGAEFTSGQALGGHMRRHRGAVPVANTTLSLGHSGPEAADLQDSDQETEAARMKNGLNLDLNQPAPEDDHHNKESRFGLPPKQQKNEEKQTALVLSTAT